MPVMTQGPSLAGTLSITIAGRASFLAAALSGLTICQHSLCSARCLRSGALVIGAQARTTVEVAGVWNLLVTCSNPAGQPAAKAYRLRV